MNSLRRLSKLDAAAKARQLAEQLVENSDSKGWTGKIGEATPDPILKQKMGKTDRNWIVIVEWKRNGSIIDGPSVIEIDLELQTARWLKSS